MVKVRAYMHWKFYELRFLILTPICGFQLVVYSSLLNDWRIVKTVKKRWLPLLFLHSAPGLNANIGQPGPYQDVSTNGTRQRCDTSVWNAPLHYSFMLIMSCHFTNFSLATFQLSYCSMSRHFSQEHIYSDVMKPVICNANFNIYKHNLLCQTSFNSQLL